jgi:hypothetical protein
VFFWNKRKLLLVSASEKYPTVQFLRNEALEVCPVVTPVKRLYVKFAIDGALQE